MKDKKCIFKLIGAVVTVAAAVTAIIVFRKEIMNFLTAVKEKAWELVQRCKCMCCTDDCDSCSCCEDCGCDCCDDDMLCAICSDCGETICFDDSVDPSDIVCPKCGKALCEDEEEAE